jgi:hypothetical protein
MGEQTKLEKVTIASCDDTTLAVEAQYNPKELGIEKSITWKDHPNAKDPNPEVEFTGGGARSMTLELLFDGYEANTSVQGPIDSLLELAKVRDMDSSRDQWLRPHQVVVAWGPLSSGRIPPFQGVIESISTKYSMFLPNGIPVRATCTIKLKEATPWRKKPKRK